MKRIIFLTMLAFLILYAVPSHAQYVLMGEYTKHNMTAADSNDFRHFWTFDVPEGVCTDSCQLIIKAVSVLGAVDIDISSRYGMHKPNSSGKDKNSYLWSTDSTIVVATWTTETVEGFTIKPALKDTTRDAYNKGDFVNFGAIMINVMGGGTNNRSDLDYDIWLVGTKLVEKEK